MPVSLLPGTSCRVATQVAGYGHLRGAFKGTIRFNRRLRPKIKHFGPSLAYYQEHMAQMPPFKSLLKSIDVEDPINIYVHRPLAYAFVWSIFKTSITPNMVTLLAVFVGFVSGCMILWGTPAAMVVAGICLWASAILDGADGFLARAKNLQSQFGRALDGWADAMVAIFTVFPAVYHIWVTYRSPSLMALTVPAILLTVVHLNIYDFYKESYLRSTRVGQGGEGDDPDAIEKRLDEARSKGRLIYVAVKHVLLPHLRRQQAIISLSNPGAMGVVRMPQTTAQTAEIYRKNNIWPMRLWSMVSLAPHSYLMAICLMTDRLDIYFYIRLFVMNVIFLVAAVWQRRATEKTNEELEALGTSEEYPLSQPIAA